MAESVEKVQEHKCRKMMPRLSIGEPTLMGRCRIVKDGLTTDQSRTAHHRTTTPALHDAVTRKEIGKSIGVLCVPPIGVLSKLFRDGQPVFYRAKVLGGGSRSRKRAQHQERHDGTLDGWHRPLLDRRSVRTPSYCWLAVGSMPVWSGERRRMFGGSALTPSRLRR